MSDQYRVVGNPIAHSRSPFIHQMFAAQTGQDIEYQRQLITDGHFEPDLDRFFAAGGCGVNVTLPYKQDAFRYAGQLSKAARQAGAVNTLSRLESGIIAGDNTDGVGLVNDISGNLGWQIAGARVLLLGAGGAVRGVLGPVLDLKPAHVVIVNRTAAKATQLATAFGEHGNIQALPVASVDGHFDLIINGTSASLSGDLLPVPATVIGSATRAYDMAYADHPTVFLRWAEQQGAVAVADGLGMLVEQAAESFRIWRSVKPDSRPVIEALRESI